MSPKPSRPAAPALVVTETPSAASRRSLVEVEPIHFDRPLLHESLGAEIEWVLPDPSKPTAAALDIDLWRGTGDGTEDVVSQAVPCYQVRLSVHVGGDDTDVTFPEFAVPMHGGLLALAQVLLELHARTEALSLASLGWDSKENARIASVRANARGGDLLTAGA